MAQPKVVFNISTEPTDDLARFESAQDLRQYAQEFDGVELYYCGPDEENKIPKDLVVGFHMVDYVTWVDCWNSNIETLTKEFTTIEAAKEFYGGIGHDAIMSRYWESLKHALVYEPEYVVFHVSECLLAESFTLERSKSDEEVITAVIEVLNVLFKDVDPESGPTLLLENLWYAGLDLHRPEIVEMLIDGVNYPKKGLMLDTGHLLHTNLDLTSQEEGLAYINEVLDRLDEYGNLTRWIKGMHLQQSLTGEHCKAMAKDAPAYGLPHSERFWSALLNALNVDLHDPFTCDGLDAFIQRFDNLQYINFELISVSREQHSGYLEQQWQALPQLRASRKKG